MVAYDKTKAAIRHYRVDKMENVRLLSALREGKEHVEHADPATYRQRSFGMFSGEEVLVTLRCSTKLLGVILDRFGSEVQVFPCGTDQFEVTARVTDSANFRGWVVGFGADMRVVKPDSVAAAVAALARAALDP